MIEAEVGATRPQAKERQGLLATARNWAMPGADSPLEPSEGAGPADTSILDFWPMELGENKFLILSHLLCGNLLGHPRKQGQSQFQPDQPLGPACPPPSQIHPAPPPSVTGPSTRRGLEFVREVGRDPANRRVAGADDH